jgi:hypothetical protein
MKGSFLAVKLETSESTIKGTRKGACKTS